jgi:mannose/fructose/N-acetylgalactosamine-specific phosphotransferase system component IIC
MAIALSVAVLGVCFFITTVNFYFQYSKYKYLTKDQKKRLNALNSPSAWLSYSFAIAIIIGIIFVTSLINIMQGTSNISKQQDTLNQQQTEQQTDSSELPTN